MSNYDIFGTMQSIANSNNAFNVWQANNQMNFQAIESQKNRDYNARQAAISRDWQEMMSNSAYQRQVADMKKAGLNPILSVGGQGAAIGSGATASNSSSGQGAKAEAESILPAMASLIASSINSAATVTASTVAANASENNASKSFLASLLGSKMAADASNYSADKHYQGIKYSADKSYSGTKYSADKSIEKSVIDGLFGLGSSYLKKSDSGDIASILGVLGSIFGG